jgi:hypothetical protein
MAARINAKHDEATRQKIQTSQLVNRLNGYALGENDPTSGQPIEITQGQLKAMEILLRKSLPDLAAVQISGDPEAPMKLEISWKTNPPSSGS